MEYDFVKPSYKEIFWFDALDKQTDKYFFISSYFESEYLELIPDFIFEIIDEDEEYLEFTRPNLSGVNSLEFFPKIPPSGIGVGSVINRLNSEIEMVAAIRSIREAISSKECLIQKP